MDRKTLGYLLTIASTILCGLPGLALLCLGSLGTLGALTGTELTADEVPYALGGLFVLFCLGLVLLLIPVAAGLWTRRTSDPVAEAVADIGTLPEDF